MSGISLATVAIITSIVSAGAGLAITGYELANQPKQPTAPTMPATQSGQAKAADAAALAQAQSLTKRRGMASTILTSPQGAAGSAQTQSATLGT